jgi:hypothetical protein
MQSVHHKAMPTLSIVPTNEVEIHAKKLRKRVKELQSKPDVRIEAPASSHCIVSMLAFFRRKMYFATLDLVLAM